MEENFNFQMSTKYDPSFKSKLTYERLYQTINKEREKEEPGFDAKEVITRRDQSSILNKLKNQLYFDIKAYAKKSDEEKFNVLKLLYFIVNTNKYDGANTLKTVSIIDLMAKSSLEHTDFKNSIYEEHFKNCLSTLQQGVDKPDEREREIEKIHSLWKKYYSNIYNTIVWEVIFKNNNLESDNLEIIHQRLKQLIASLNRNQILKLHRPNEGVIDTFYNMMLSSRILAEIEEHLKAVYDYSNEANTSKELIDLSLNELFYNTMIWEEFKNTIDIKNINFNDKKIKMIWSLLLRDVAITFDDIQKIDMKAYNFAKQYTREICEYWIFEIKKQKRILIFEWIVVFQELMCIYIENIKYDNRYIRYKNPKRKLSAAIKNFKSESKFSRDIILNRLSNRELLIFQAPELFEDKIQIDKCILELEKIIFSYKNLDDIKAAHSYLYFHVTSILATGDEYNMKTTIEEKINEKLAFYRIPKIMILPDSYNYILFLLQVLSQDQTYCYLRNKSNNKILEVIKNIAKFIQKPENWKKAFKIHQSFFQGRTASDILIEEFSEWIQNLYSITQNYKRDYIPSRVFTIPIYFGDKNEYYCLIRFLFRKEYHTLTVYHFSFIRKDEKEFNIYRQLLIQQ